MWLIGSGGCRRMDENEGRGKGCFSFLGREQIRKVGEGWDNRSMMACRAERWRKRLMDGGKVVETRQS